MSAERERNSSLKINKEKTDDFTYVETRGAPTDQTDR